jgi:hypothetical protein
VKKERNWNSSRSIASLTERPRRSLVTHVLSLRLCVYVCLSRFGSPCCVCVQKSEVKMQPAIQPSSPSSERREKKEKATILQSTHGRCCRYRSESNQIPQIPNLITTSSNWKRISREKREEREEYIEGMQCCHQKSIQDRQGCASTSFTVFHFK